MQMNLMCGRCSEHWTVERWTPTAMSCPRCGSGKLGNARSLIEAQQRLAKRDAAEQRKRLENGRQT
jgi:DNA-directed RNA polymerase subunit RPC12/RpoP